MRIIDFHCHPAYDFHFPTHGVSIDAERFREDLLANGITKCCGSVIERAMNHCPVEDYRQILPQLNDRAINYQQIFGDFYTAGIHVHPAFVDLSCREIERAHEAGVRLIGELVPYMMGWSECSTPAFLEIMDCARAYDMTVNIHPTSIKDMYELSCALPDLKLVWAHLSAYGGLEDHIEMMRRNKNLCFDISAHGTDQVGTLRRTIDQVGCERLLFGTDYPGIGPASDLAAIMLEPLTDSEREAILWHNAARLLGIE